MQSNFRTSSVAHDRRLLLRLADIEHAFVLLELAESLLCDRVLALVLMKGNEINVFGGNDCSILRTKASIIGATAVVDAKRWP